MGFLAAAPVVTPMLLGAAAGGIMDKDNPLRGALLGATGGAVLGPAMSGLTSAGTAATEAALGAGMGAEAGTAASQVAAAQGLTGLAAESPMYNAMIGEQIAGMGNAGIANYLGSAGVPNIGANMAGFAVGGPQGMLSGMSGKDMMLKGGKMLAQNMIQGQPQQMPQMAPPPAMPPPRQPMGPPPQVGRFVTGMPSMARRRDPREEMWGYS